MTTQVESASPEYPTCRIQATPCPDTAQVWFGDVLIAESGRCLVVTETDHDDRLYFPESDVRWKLFAASNYTSVCPFKGRATYWTLTSAQQPPVENVAWTYRTPFPEVVAIAGYVSFCDDVLSVVLVEDWPDGSRVAAKFPLWGDADELRRLVDVEPTADGRFIGPPHGPTRRNVVEGGQLLGEAIVAASKTLVGQRITSASMIFVKAASFDAPVDVAVEVLRRGKTFSSADVRVSQDGVLRSAGILLADSGAADVMRAAEEMPDVPGPDAATPFPGFSMTGRDIRVIDGAYDPDPDRLGPPTIDVWVRFRGAPAEPYLHAALLAQSTTHWTIAAGMRPHRGLGEARAHVTLSTGIMKATIAFHDEVDISDWLLYTNHAFWAGRGLVQGDGRVFTRDGRLAASYTIQAMVRDFATDPAAMGHDSRMAM
jgi:acyl-CoA thioesterase II